jgi:hypothetical protein
MRNNVTCDITFWNVALSTLNVAAVSGIVNRCQVLAADGGPNGAEMVWLHTSTVPVGVAVGVRETVGVGVRVWVGVGVGVFWPGMLGMPPNVHQSPTVVLAPGPTVRCHCKPKPLSAPSALVSMVLSNPGPGAHDPETGHD